MFDYTNAVIQARLAIGQRACRYRPVLDEPVKRSHLHEICIRSVWMDVVLGRWLLAGREGAAQSNCLLFLLQSAPTSPARQLLPVQLGRPEKSDRLGGPRHCLCVLSKQPLPGNSHIRLIQLLIMMFICRYLSLLLLTTILGVLSFQSEELYRGTML